MTTDENLRSGDALPFDLSEANRALFLLRKHACQTRPDYEIDPLVASVRDGMRTPRDAEQRSEAAQPHLCAPPPVETAQGDHFTCPVCRAEMQIGDGKWLVTRPGDATSLFPGGGPFDQAYVHHVTTLTARVRQLESEREAAQPLPWKAVAKKYRKESLDNFGLFQQYRRMYRTETGELPRTAEARPDRGSPQHYDEAFAFMRAMHSRGFAGFDKPGIVTHLVNLMIGKSYKDSAMKCPECEGRLAGCTWPVPHDEQRRESPKPEGSK